MPVFEFEAGGRTLEIDAPDEGAALSAFKQFGAPELQIDMEPDTRTEAEKRADARVSKERLENRGVVQSFDDAIRNLTRGLPIGSYMDEIAAGGNAAIHSVTGGAYGEPYRENLEYQRAYDRAVDAESTKLGELPVIGDVTVGGATKLTGALATAPFLPVARVFGGNAMLANMGNAAVSGAGYGALYGSGEGDRAAERTGNAMVGAALGGGLGAAVPPVAAGARNALNAVASRTRAVPAEVSQYSRGAVDRVTRAVGDDELGPMNYMRQSRQLGQEGMLADMGPNLTDQASAIATQPGGGSRTIRRALENRRAGSASRTEADVSRTLGPARNLVALEENVVGQARAQAAPHYEQFYQTTIPMTRELSTVMRRVPERVLNKAEELARVDPNYEAYAAQTGEPTGIVFDLIKRASDDLAQSAGRGTNEFRLFSRLSRDLRNAVDNALSPGQPQASPWAVARTISGDGLQFRQGLEEGGRAFSRGTHPDQMAADLAAMSQVERAGYQEGARGQIRDVMGNAATTRGENAAAAARRTLGSENARRKIGMVSNNPEVLIRRLEAESRFQTTNNDVLSNSRTAGRQAAQREFPNAADTSAANEVGKKSLSGAAMEAAYRIGNALLGGALNANRIGIAEDAARMLVAQGASRDAIVRGLRQYARDQRANAAASQALERVARAVLEGGRQRAVQDATSP
jgi:hypothetical protein